MRRRGRQERPQHQRLQCCAVASAGQRSRADTPGQLLGSRVAARGQQTQPGQVQGIGLLADRGLQRQASLAQDCFSGRRVTKRQVQRCLAQRQFGPHPARRALSQQSSSILEQPGGAIQVTLGLQQARQIGFRIDHRSIMA